MKVADAEAESTWTAVGVSTRRDQHAAWRQRTTAAAAAAAADDDGDDCDDEDAATKATHAYRALISYAAAIDSE